MAIEFKDVIHGAAPKATPVDADELAMVDSGASFIVKNLTWGSLKAAIKSYYDSVTATLTNKTINLTDNTLSGTAAQFNAAVSDGNFPLINTSSTDPSGTFAAGEFHVNTTGDQSLFFATQANTARQVFLAGQDTIGTSDITNDAVTYAKMQNVTATDKLLGRSSAGAGDVEEITCTAAGRALLDDLDASAQRGTLGLGTLATQNGTFSAKADDSAVVHNTGTETVGGAKTFSSAVTVPDEAYDATAWNGSLTVPTKNAVRDKIESIPALTDGDKGDVVVSVSGTVWSVESATRPKIITSIDDANGNEIIKTPATASAVNEVTITNAATGNAPEISASGGDTNVDLKLTPKGTGRVVMGNTVGLLDTDASHYLNIKPGSNLTVNRDFTINTGDASRALTINADTTLGGGAHSGTNTGDQTSIVGITGTKAQFNTAVSDGDIVYSGDALGTPSSGTLTNCTGLPVAGVAASTTAPLGVGSIELGHASDTTISRTAAGDIAVEGNAIYRAGGTDVPLADGGTGASLTDPNADRIMFWDDSAGQMTWLTPGTNLTITGTTIDAAGGGSGSPGGSTTQVQYNNAGAFGGATNVAIEGGNLKLVSTTDPTPPTDGIILTSKLIAGRHLPKMVGPSGIDTVMQVGLHGNSIFMVAPASGTTAPTAWGGTLTTAATMSLQKTIASANPWLATSRKRFQSSTTAGNQTGMRTAYTQWFRASAAGFGGFFFRTQFGHQLNLNGAQLFHGLCASTAVLAATAGSVAALVNMIGMGYDTTDANTGNWFLYRNDGTGTATKVDLGANAVRANVSHGYDLIIYCPPGAATDIFVRIINIHTGVTVLDTSYNTDIPAVNTGLAYKAETNNGAVASAQNIEVAKTYIESDY